MMKIIIEYLLLMVNLMLLLFSPIVFIITVERLYNYGDGWVTLILSICLFCIGVILISVKKMGKLENILYSLWRKRVN